MAERLEWLEGQIGKFGAAPAWEAQDDQLKWLMAQLDKKVASELGATIMSHCHRHCHYPAMNPTGDLSRVSRLLFVFVSRSPCLCVCVCVCVCVGWRVGDLPFCLHVSVLGPLFLRNVLWPF